ncbi:MAG: hypothetical protein WBG50_16850 [Desulfomonilaceae bacterium]
MKLESSIAARKSAVPAGAYDPPMVPAVPLNVLSSDTNSRQRLAFTCAFFFGLWWLLFFLGHWAEPVVHPYFDQVGIRDAGTLFSYYASRPEPLKTLIGRAMLHIEGPIQFMLLNAYCYTIGNLLPLNPSTLQFPNTVLAFLATVFAYLLGTKLVSRRLGYCCALAFAFSPWLGETMRQPWAFNTLSCLLHFSIFYCFVSLCENTESPFYRVAAPALLAVYLFTGMDWPSFLFALVLFLATCGRLRLILRNPYNLLVAASVIVQVAWPMALALTGRGRWLNGTMLLYPFLRYGDLATNPDFWSRIWKSVITGWGPQLIFAISGLGLYVVRWRGELFPDRMRRALFDSLCVWFVGAGYALFRSSSSETYLYVAAMPTALLAGLVLVRLRNLYVIAAAVVMIACQVYITSGQFVTNRDDGRRVLAAATYLIEQRPDLLSADKTAFLPRNVAADVGQYARGRNRRIVMPREFPVDRRKYSIGSDEKTLLEFVDAYNEHRRIRADWLVLDTALFAKDVRSANFYASLRDDPSIRWIARFKDPGGELFIGAVDQRRGSPLGSAPIMDTRRLSEKYEAKYDRIGFLKHNVQYVDHY